MLLDNTVNNLISYEDKKLYLDKLRGIDLEISNIIDEGYKTLQIYIDLSNLNPFNEALDYFRIRKKNERLNKLKRNAIRHQNINNISQRGFSSLCNNIKFFFN